MVAKHPLRRKGRRKKATIQPAPTIPSCWAEAWEKRPLRAAGAAAVLEEAEEADLAAVRAVKVEGQAIPLVGEEGRVAQEAPVMVAVREAAGEAGSEVGVAALVAVAALAAGHGIALP